MTNPDSRIITSLFTTRRSAPVSQPHIQLRQSRNAEFRHCVFDDVFRFLLLHGFNLEIPAAACRAGHDTWAADDGSSCRIVGSSGEQAWPSSAAADGLPHLRGQCIVVLVRPQSRAASHKTGLLRATGRLIHGGGHLATAEARIEDEQGNVRPRNDNLLCL